MANDLVRKITISASGENIDSTAAKVKALAAANDNLKQSTTTAGSAWVDYAAKVYLAKTAYEGLSGAADAVSGALKGVTSAVASALAAVAMAIPNAVINTWQETTDLLEKYIELAGKAGKLGVSTDFFQQQTLAAQKMGGTVQTIVTLMEKLRTVTTEQLGGSAGQQRVDELKSFGNFSGNTGVSQLQQATTAEQKYQAVVSLIDQAMQKGERLAAIDVAKTFFGDEAAANLAKYPDYFDRMQSAADKLTSKDIVSSEDVSRALDLSYRLQVAENTISKEWFPHQQSLNSLVMFFKELWVEIVELVASGFSWVEKWVNKLLSVPASLWQSFQDWRHAGEALGPALPDYAGDAHKRLAIGLANPNTVAQAGLETSALSNQLRPDTSKSKKPEEVQADAVDRAINSLNKHIEAQKADALAVGLGEGALARFRAEATETAAVAANGGKETAAQAAKFADLKVAAEAAANALAKAKVASEISREKQLLFASDEDVKIANQLKGIYGDDIPKALASSEAAAIRFTDQMKDIVKTAKDLASAFANDFVSGIMSGKNAMDSLTSAASSLGKSLTTGGINNIIKDPTSLTGYVEAGVGLITQLFTGNSEKKKKEEADRQAAAQAAAQAAQAGQDRANNFTLQGQLATIDTNTIAGQIQAFDLQANKQRADEAKAGGQAIVALENTLAIQRKEIVDKANQQVIASYKAFLDSIKTGSLSTLSPEDQLKFAQSKFGGDITGANAGNQDSINAVTQDAQNLLNIAKSFYASTTGYTEIYQSVTDAVSALASKSSLFSGAGYASGGVVVNGIRGVDSVTAKLAGGEFVTRTASVNSSTLGALQHINRTGRAPQSDNSDVVHVLTQGFNGQTAVLAEKLDTLADRMKRLEDTTRQTSTQRRVPGSNQKAA